MQSVIWYLPCIQICMFFLLHTHTHIPFLPHTLKINTHVKNNETHSKNLLSGNHHSDPLPLAVVRLSTVTTTTSQMTKYKMYYSSSSCPSSFVKETQNLVKTQHKMYSVKIRIFSTKLNLNLTHLSCCWFLFVVVVVIFINTGFVYIFIVVIAAASCVH